VSAGPPRDRGLQPERTRLAWRRTVLAQAVVALLLVRLALTAGPTGAVVVAAAFAGWSAVVAAIRVRTGRSAWWDPGPAVIPLVALLTVGYAVLGVVLVLAR
jgi:Domain of unknown function (DUF202)